jgi:hypothetical protein
VSASEQLWKRDAQEKADKIQKEKAKQEGSRP